MSLVAPPRCERLVEYLSFKSNYAMEEYSIRFLNENLQFSYCLKGEKEREKCIEIRC